MQSSSGVYKYPIHKCKCLLPPTNYGIFFPLTECFKPNLRHL